MNLSIKNILPLWILCFAFSFLYGAETAEENPYPINYTFYEQEDCIKVKITLPEDIKAKSTLYKINTPDPEVVAIQIKNNQMNSLEDVYHLVDIEMHAFPSPEEGGATFQITEKIVKKPTNRKILKDEIIATSTYFVKTDKQVDLRHDVLPRLTGSRNSHQIKYVRFFIIP
ncbi:hypothetical protein [Simkania sp.]|uniref:hypothetical protein n=1 Tax=Simkania sp. TaxID=34094 RepID=UPI003B51947A